MTVNIARLIMVVEATFLFVYLAVIYRHCVERIPWRSNPAKWPSYACAVVASALVLAGLVINQLILLAEDPFPGSYFYIVGLALGLKAAYKASKERKCDAQPSDST